MNTVKVLCDDVSLLGESPIWDSSSDSLFWVDIEDNKLKQWSEHNLLIRKLDNQPTSVGLDGSLAPNQLLMTVSDGLGIYDLRDNKYHEQYHLEIKDTRLNDGTYDLNGNYWVGSMDTRPIKKPIGTVYRYSNNYLEPMIDQIGITNGLSFTDNDMFISDSLSGELFRYDYNGNIPENREIINTFDPSIETPDGATIKTNKYWSAMWGGGSVLSYDLESYKPEEEVSLPAKYITSCSFNEETMFITSAKEDDKSKDAGKVFYVSIF